MSRASRMGIMLCAACLPSALLGCSGDKLSATALAARHELQMDRAQAALDQLTANSRDDSAVAHYLKAVAMERLEQLDAAKSEADIAMKRDENNARYRAFTLRLKLFNGDDTAIDPLLKLLDEHSSDPAVSLFGVYALQARMVRLRAEQKPRAARAHLDKAAACLKTALSLAAEIPEHHHELIGMAIWFEQPNEALKLVETMLREEPENPAFLRSKIQVLTLAKQPSEAIRTGALLYRKLERSELAALELSQTLSQLPPSPAVIEQFTALRDRFPNNTAILLRSAWALGKSGQSDEACKLLATAFDQQSDVRIKRLLAQASIAIPLETEALELTASQLQKFGPHVRDPQWLTYLEGRLALARRDSEAALSKLQSVVESARHDNAASPALAREAARWLRRLLAEKTLTDQVRKAAELTLSRAGLNRLDENDLRQDAQSLLNLLETHAPPDSAPQKPSP